MFRLFLLVGTIALPSICRSSQLLASDPAREVWRSERNCGLNCTYLMLKSHGITTSYDRLKELIPISDFGSSLTDVSDTLTRCGLKNDALRCSPSELAGLEMPVIAHVEFTNSQGVDGLPIGHFVLITAINRSTQEVAYIDGTTAIFFERPIHEFFRSWTGIAIAKRQPKWGPYGTAFMAGVLLSLLFSIMLKLRAHRLLQRS